MMYQNMGIPDVSVKDAPRGATLGAGTTLTRNAPPDTLTISRSKQMSISGWKRPVKKQKVS